jgi:four helix bundle protein
MAAFDDLRDLAAWRLAHQMTVRVDIFLHCPDFRRHYTLCDRLADAARAGPRYIADGHASRNHLGFAQLVRKAAASEAEVLDHLIDAHAQKLITSDELTINEQLVRRALNEAAGLIRQLEAATRAGGPARTRRSLSANGAGGSPATLRS